MIFKSFLLSSLSFSMRIINSVVVVGLYYGLEKRIGMWMKYTIFTGITPKPKRWNSDFRTISYKRIEWFPLLWEMDSISNYSYCIKKEKKLIEVEDAEC